MSLDHDNHTLMFCLEDDARGKLTDPNGKGFILGVNMIFESFLCITRNNVLIVALMERSGGLAIHLCYDGVMQSVHITVN